MSDPNQPSTPPGWYPDGQGGQRWWDGTQWTEHTQPPAPPAAPGVPGHDLPTQVAPNRAANYPAGQPGQPGQPGAQQPQQPQQGVYGAPATQSGFGQQPPFGGYQGGSGAGGGGRGKLIAVIGGAVGALILAIILVVVLFKVVLGGGPDDVAKDYLDAQFEGDFSQQCELLSKDQQDAFLEYSDADDCDEYAENAEDDKKDSDEDFEDEYDESYDDFLGDVDREVEIKDVEEKGDDEAIVDYKVTYEYTGDNDDIVDDFLGGDKKDSSTGQIKLVKEDGDWKVDDPFYSDDSEE